MKKAIAIAIPILVLAGLVGWRYSTKKAQESDLKTSQATRGKGGAAVTLAVAAPKTLTRTLDTVGSVASPYNVKLAPKVAGRIDFLTVREGDKVKAGQVLVRINGSEIEGQVLEQRASVAEARSRLAQAQVTQGSTDVGISAQIRQQAAALSSAQADLAQVSQNYSSQVASADSAVTDAEARVASARALVESASASVESAQANAANAQSKYERTDNLYKQGFISAQDVDDARTLVQVQQGAVKVSQKQLSSAQSALNSALAVQKSAEAQAAIARRKGKSDIAVAESKVRQARANLDVASANRSQAPAYQANLAALRASVAAAEGQLRQAEARRADTILSSPIDGTVTSRSMDPGAIASSGSQILTVEFLDWVYVTATIPIEQTSAVVSGMPATITFDALPGQTFSGNIAQVNPSADAQSRQFGIQIRLENLDHRLRPGMFAKLNLVLSRVDALVTVPREAVKQVGDTYHVFTVDSDSTAHDQVVTIGASDSQSIEIKQGLKAGDKVVSLSYQPVKDGQKIKQGDDSGKGGSGGGKGRGGRGKQG